MSTTTDMDFLRVAAAKAKEFAAKAPAGEQQQKEWRYWHDEFFRFYRRLNRPAAYADTAALLTKTPPRQQTAAPRPQTSGSKPRAEKPTPAPKANPRVPLHIWNAVHTALAAYARNPSAQYDYFVTTVERALAEGVNGADLPGGAHSIYLQITGGGRYREGEAEIETMLRRRIDPLLRVV
jgi:hypothetical protein